MSIQSPSLSVSEHKKQHHSAPLRPAEEAPQVSLRHRRWVLQILVGVLLRELYHTVFGVECRVGGLHACNQAGGELVPQQGVGDAPVALLGQEGIHARVEHRELQLQQPVLLALVLLKLGLEVCHRLLVQGQGHCDQLAELHLGLLQLCVHHEGEGGQLVPHFHAALDTAHAGLAAARHQFGGLVLGGCRWLHLFHHFLHMVGHRQQVVTHEQVLASA
mmetsp:Transcript_8359/g.18358  ORF Transcript_8359/g.18358 Transcript_8359/m.18358 type:complete len:218 (+) Transcript_8359:225-878(+)